MMAIPGLNREMIPDSRVICLSLIDPANRDEMNVVAPCGATPISPLRVQCDL